MVYMHAALNIILYRKKFWEQIPRFFDATRIAQRMMNPKIRCWGNVFNDPLPSNGKSVTWTAQEITRPTEFFYSCVYSLP
jgi:hypothetical protein